MAKNPVKFVPQWESDWMRKKVADQLGSVRLPAENEKRKVDRLAEFGTSEVVLATGRANCRCCGEKIAKGQIAIRFGYDFTGNGAWTGVEVQIHGDQCWAPGTHTLNMASVVQQEVGQVAPGDTTYIAKFKGLDEFDGEVRCRRFRDANTAANHLLGLGAKGVKIWSNLTQDWA